MPEAGGQSYATRMARGVAAGFAGTTVARLSGFIAVPLLLHILGIELYGVWAIAGLLINSQGLFDFGMTAATARFVAEADHQEDGRGVLRIVYVSLAAYGLVTLAYTVIVLLLTNKLLGAVKVSPDLVSQSRLLILSTIPLFAITNVVGVLGGALTGLQRVGSANLAVMIAQPGYLAGLAITSINGYGVAGVVGSTLVLYTVQVVVAFYFLRKYLPRSDTKPKSISIRRLATFGATGQLLTVSSFAMLQAPKFLVAISLGASAVGKLDLASRLPALGLVLLAPVLPPLMPAAVRLQHQDSDGGPRRLNEIALRYTAAAAFLCFGLIALLGQDILDLWLGSVAEGLGNLVALLCLSYALYALASVPTEIALGLSLLRPILITRACGAVLVCGSVTLGVSASQSLTASLAAMGLGFLAFYGTIEWQFHRWLNAIAPVVKPLLASCGALVTGAAIAGMGRWTGAPSGPSAILAATGATAFYCILLRQSKTVSLTELRDLGVRVPGSSESHSHSPK